MAVPQWDMCFKVIVWGKPFSFPQGEHFQMLGCEWVGEGGVLLSSFLQENHFGHFAIVTHWKEEVECGCFEGRGRKRSGLKNLQGQLPSCWGIHAFSLTEKRNIWSTPCRVRPESNWLEWIMYFIPTALLEIRDIFWQIEWPTACLPAWLTDWLTDRPIDWPTDWPTDWLTDLLTYRMTDYPTDCLTNRLTAWLTNWWNGWPTYWLANRLTAWNFDWLINRQTDCLTD